MLQFWMDQFILLFPDSFIPKQMIAVYTAVTSVWNALPGPVRFAFTACFGLACLFAVLKMVS